jgi:4-hydroxy-tetrahydrodipicolinate synthase
MTPRELKERLKGVVAITVTPMKENYELDEDGIRRHLSFLIENGITGENGVLVTTGSTGECGTLSIDERKKVLEIALDEVKGRIPILAGCNHTNLYDVIDLARHAEKNGAAGIMVLAPFYWSPGDNEIVNFFEKLADATSLGFFVYNNVDVVRKELSVSLMSRLAEIDNVVGMKECTPDFFKFGRMVRTLGEKITVVNGCGEFREPYASIAGSPGWISTTANLAPKMVIDLWKRASKKNWQEAKKIHSRFYPYLDLISEVTKDGGEPLFIAIIKEAVHIVVGIDSGVGRIPLPRIKPEIRKRLINVLEEMNLT